MMKVCRVCLAMSVKMYQMSEHKLSFAYEQVTGVEINAEDKLPKMLCWECAARLSSAHNFLKKALKTHLILVDKMKSSRFISMGDIEFIDKTHLKSTLGVTFYRDNYSYIHLMESDTCHEEDSKAEFSQPSYIDINNKEEQNFIPQDIVSAEKDLIKREYSDGTQKVKVEDEYNTEACTDNERYENKFQNTDFKIETIEIASDGNASDEEVVIDSESNASGMSEEGNHIKDETNEIYDHVKQNRKRKRSKVFPHCKELRVVLEDIMLALRKQKTQDPLVQSTKDNNDSFSQDTLNQKILFKDENNSEETHSNSINTVKVLKHIDTTCENSSIIDPVSVWIGFVNNDISLTHDDTISSSKLLLCDKPQRKETSPIKNIPKHTNCTYKTSISKHINNKVFICDYCTFKTSVKLRLIGHINTKHNKINVFKCTLCKYKAYDKLTLTRHVNSKHTKTDAFNCSFCDFKTHNKRYLKKHDNSKHTKTDTFNCSSCDYKAYYKRNLKEHINSKHTKTDTFNCSFCDYKAYYKRNLKEHVNSKHTKTDTFNCSFCDYKTHNKRYLKPHVNSQHTKTDTFNCSFCDFKTHNKTQLKAHVNSQHTKTDTFNCSFCDYKTYAKCNLRKHVNSKHTKVTAFICSYCSFKTYKKFNLNAHVNAKHTKLVSFNCSFCNYKAYNMRILKGHVNSKHTKVNVYICSDCNFQVYYKGSLKEHIKAKHS